MTDAQLAEQPASEFFDKFARYKLMQVIYELSLPESRSGQAEPAGEELRRLAHEAGTAVYDEADPEACWAQTAAVLALQQRRIAALEAELALAKAGPPTQKSASGVLAKVRSRLPGAR